LTSSLVFKPYRLLFPAGAVFGLIGVGHWLLYSLGVLAHYRSIFHSMAQIQAFMSCLAAGFLLTAIPRRLETAPAEPWHLAVATLAPLGLLVSAWLEQWIWSQVFWLVFVATLVIFGWTRFARRGRNPPNGFVWIPFALVLGALGSLLAGARGFSGGPLSLLFHDLGRGLVLQGMFLALVAGVGSLALPLILRKEAAPDGGGSARDRWARWMHLVWMVLLLGSFPVEHLLSLRVGLALRALSIAGPLWLGAGTWRTPGVPGWHRGLVWVSTWMLPLGYVVAAVFPQLRVAGLHITFIGGFALMGLSVAAHVALAHGGYQDEVNGRTWQSLVLGGGLLVAMGARVLADVDASRFVLWLGVASGAFVVSILCWMGWIGARVIRQAPG
jgi:uncharacterized protein involved in response to NO